MSNVFITSASGNIGTELVPLLTESSAVNTLILPTSNAARLESSVPKSNKITVVQGSIQDPQWLETQFSTHKIDTVFLNLTGTDELFTTMNFLSSIQRSPTVKHLVYLSANGNFLAPDFQKTVLKNCQAAHVLVKVITEQALQATRARDEAKGFSWTIIGPTLFMENDRRARGAMMKEGFFPEPIGMSGVSRVACRDIALGAAKAIEDQGRVWDRKKIMIGTKETWTVGFSSILTSSEMSSRGSGRLTPEQADDVAKLWGTALGKSIRVQTSDADGLASVEKHFVEGIGPAWGRDLRLVSSKLGTSASSDEIASLLTASLQRCTRPSILRASAAGVLL